MDVAVGEGRSIVQHEKRIVFVRFLNLLVDFLVFPTRENLGLPSGQVGLHRELRFWQIQCLFVVHSKDTETSIDWGGRQGEEWRSEAGVAVRQWC